MSWKFEIENLRFSCRIWILRTSDSDSSWTTVYIAGWKRVETPSLVEKSPTLVWRRNAVLTAYQDEKDESFYFCSFQPSTRMKLLVFPCVLQFFAVFAIFCYVFHPMRRSTLHRVMTPKQWRHMIRNRDSRFYALASGRWNWLFWIWKSDSSSNSMYVYRF